jgi:large subunit ribosomal protein L30
MMADRIRVTQIRSPIGRDPRQRTNLIGLGLNKISRSRVLHDLPVVRGRIAQVHHLVRVEPVEESELKVKPKAERKVKPKAERKPRAEKPKAERKAKAKKG